MRWMLLCLWVLTGSAQPRLTILLHDSAGLGKPVLAEMKRESARILLRGGVEIAWIERGVATADSDAAESAGVRIVLRLLLAHDRNPSILGETIGSRVTLFTQAIAELAARAQWQFPDLLGHAAAHEFGHLLLGSGHTYAGVMRSPWSPAALRLLAHGGLTFRPDELRCVSTPILEPPERGDCPAPAASRPRN